MRKSAVDRSLPPTQSLRIRGEEHQGNLALSGALALHYGASDSPNPVFGRQPWNEDSRRNSAYNL